MKACEEITEPGQLPLVLKTQHVMELTGLSRPSVYNLFQRALHTGIFPVRRVGAKYLVSRDSFLAWLQSQDNMGKSDK